MERYMSNEALAQLKNDIEYDITTNLSGETNTSADALAMVNRWGDVESCINKLENVDGINILAILNEQFIDTARQSESIMKESVEAINSNTDRNFINLGAIIADSKKEILEIESVKNITKNVGNFFGIDYVNNAINFLKAHKSFNSDVILCYKGKSKNIIINRWKIIVV